MWVLEKLQKKDVAVNLCIFSADFLLLHFRFLCTHYSWKLMYIDNKGVLGYDNNPMALLSLLDTTETKINVLHFNI